VANKYEQPPKELRGRWYLQVEKYNKTVRETGIIFGISRKTYYKWYKRDHPIGKTGRPPRRVHPQTKIQGNIRVFIVENKMRYNYGPKKMSLILKRELNIYIFLLELYIVFTKRKY